MLISLLSDPGGFIPWEATKSSLPSLLSLPSLFVVLYWPLRLFSDCHLAFLGGRCRFLPSSAGGHVVEQRSSCFVYFSFCLDVLYLAAVGISPPGCKSLNTWEAHTTLFKQESASSSSEWEERDRVFWEASRFFSLRSSSRGCL